MKVLPRHGTLSQLATAGSEEGELIYLEDLEYLAVADGKGGIKDYIKIPKKFNGLQEDYRNQIPVFIKLNRL